ncbi:protein tipE isoform X1 [Lepeophtheirus salmonis]|uniref:Protein tipE n=1 Tax=Lepeophtheirus salmonis TaxID=72036 RepID=A0A0K2TPZ1_LEPSM|nr:protein tipE-like isoform X1 [Lepeophtheirus salmonis]XP_040575163.1 protein tipE-like isoform X1 [Lepeophtheirus salmonis]
MGESEDGDVEPIKATRLEEIKYYTSVTLGTLCIVCIFAFLFLVPFVLDPAISTLSHQFRDNPITCKASYVQAKIGSSKCNWSSCREGCTATMYKCYQVRVIYSLRPYVNGTKASAITDWVDLTRFDEKENSTVRDTPLLINIKGCGYPPTVNCQSFTEHYEQVMLNDDVFACYVSELNPWIVLEEYSFSETVGSVVASIVIPNGLFLISLIVLLYWYCPYCQARCHKYETQNDEDDIMDQKDEDELRIFTPTLGKIAGVCHPIQANDWTWRKKIRPISPCFKDEQRHKYYHHPPYNSNGCSSISENQIWKSLYSSTTS